MHSEQCAYPIRSKHGRYSTEAGRGLLAARLDPPDRPGHSSLHSRSRQALLVQSLIPVKTDVFKPQMRLGMKKPSWNEEVSVYQRKVPVHNGQGNHRRSHVKSETCLILFVPF